MILAKVLRPQSTSAALDRGFTTRQIESGRDLSTACLFEQIEEWCSVVGQQSWQQRRVAEMQDVYSVQVHFPARERGVGTGVMPERPVVTKQLQDDVVPSRRYCRSCNSLQVDSLLGKQAAGDLTQRVISEP